MYAVYDIIPPHIAASTPGAAATSTHRCDPCMTFGFTLQPLPLEQQLPLHKPVVISLGASSGSDTEAEEDTAAAEAPQLKFGGALDQFLKAQRQTVEVGNVLEM